MLGMYVLINDLQNTVRKMMHTININTKTADANTESFNKSIKALNKLDDMRSIEIAKLIRTNKDYKIRIENLERKIQSFDEELTTMNNYIIEVRQEAKLSAMTGGTNK